MCDGVRFWLVELEVQEHYMYVGEEGSRWNLAFEVGIEDWCQWS